MPAPADHSQNRDAVPTRLIKLYRCALEGVSEKGTPDNPVRYADIAADMAQYDTAKFLDHDGIYRLISWRLEKLGISLAKELAHRGLVPGDPEGRELLLGAFRQDEDQYGIGLAGRDSNGRSLLDMILSGIGSARERSLWDHLCRYRCEIDPAFRETFFSRWNIHVRDSEAVYTGPAPNSPFEKRLCGRSKHHRADLDWALPHALQSSAAREHLPGGFSVLEHALAHETLYPDRACTQWSGDARAWSACRGEGFINHLLWRDHRLHEVGFKDAPDIARLVDQMSQRKLMPAGADSPFNRLWEHARSKSLYFCAGQGMTMHTITEDMCCVAGLLTCIKVATRDPESIPVLSECSPDQLTAIRDAVLEQLKRPLMMALPADLNRSQAQPTVITRALQVVDAFLEFRPFTPPPRSIPRQTVWGRFALH